MKRAPAASGPDPVGDGQTGRSAGDPRRLRTPGLRPTIAFYGGVKQYESFFAAHGFEDVARKLKESVQRGDYKSVAHLIPDGMVRTFVAVGEPDKVREQIGGGEGARIVPGV
jgi:hypothetical protein